MSCYKKEKSLSIVTMISVMRYVNVKLILLANLCLSLGEVIRGVSQG